jgi:hypothetical protein
VRGIEADPALDPPSGDGQNYDARKHCPGVGDTDDPTYATVRGTSFASPILGSVAAYLFAAVPGASVADVKRALLASRTDTQPGEALGNAGAGQVDAFAALLALADAKGKGDEVRRFLVDVSDGTADGNLRADRTGADVAESVPPGAGDGTLSMADVRAFRDAMLETMRLDALAAGDASFETRVKLDGSSDHRKRDLNRDGCLLTSAGMVAARGSQAACGAVDHDDRHFARFDFDGDGRVTAADLRILTDAMTRAGVDVVALEGHPIDQLSALVPTANGAGSVDVHVLLEGSTAEYRYLEVECGGPGAPLVRRVPDGVREVLCTIPVAGVPATVTVKVFGLTATERRPLVTRESVDGVVSNLRLGEDRWLSVDLPPDPPRDGGAGDAGQVDSGLVGCTYGMTCCPQSPYCIQDTNPQQCGGVCGCWLVGGQPGDPGTFCSPCTGANLAQGLCVRQ